MLSKNELKYIQSLCHKKQRQETGLFLAEGPKLVEELLHSDYRIKKILATGRWTEEHGTNHIVEQVTEAELGKISALQTDFLSCVWLLRQSALPAGKGRG